MVVSGVLGPKHLVINHHLHLKLFYCQILVTLVAANWPLGETSENPGALARGCSHNTGLLVHCPCQTDNVLGSEFVTVHRNARLLPP